MGEGVVAARIVHINMVQGVFSPGRDVDMLVKCSFKETVFCLFVFGCF